MYGKLSSIENDDISKKKDLYTLSAQLLAENEYLRKGVQNVIGNVLNKENLNAPESKGIEKSVIPIKKKRNPTQINFDFLEKEGLIEKVKQEDNQV